MKTEFHNCVVANAEDIQPPKLSAAPCTMLQRVLNQNAPMLSAAPYMLQRPLN